MNETQQGVFKEAMEKAMFKSDNEKTRFDKLLGRDDMLRIKTIFTKPVMTMEDVNEIQNTIVSNEIKLTDFQRSERYINHKYYIVLGMYASRYCKAIRADLEYQKQDLPEPVKKVRVEIQKDYATMYKEMVNAYLFGVRSPLSSEGNLINLLGTERKEYSYEGNLSPVPGQQTIKGVE